MNISAFAIGNLLFGLTCFCLAAVVFVFGKEKIHKLWGLFNIGVGLWGLGRFFAVITNNYELSLVWWRIAHLGGVYTPVFLLHVVYILGNLFNKKRRIILFLCYMECTAYQIFSLSRLMGEDLVYKFNSFYFPTPSYYHVKLIGLNFPLWIPIFIFILFYAFYLLYNSQKNLLGESKKHAKWFLLAMFLGWAGSAWFFFPVYNINLYPYGVFLIPLYCGVATYAIFRHGMLNIEVIVKKTIVYAGLFAGVYTIIAGFAFLGQVVFEQIRGGNRWISLMPSIAVIVLILRPLETFLIHITDKFLFQKKYDYKTLLKTFTSEVLTVLDIDKLTHLTVEKLSDIIKIKSCGILLLNKQKNQYELAASLGIKPRNIVFGMDNTLVAFLDKTRLYFSIKYQDKDSKLPNKVLEDMNKLKLEIAIPLVVHDELIGILTLGKKKSDKEYIEDDMDILLTLARTLSIAISNAEMFDELGKTQAEAAQKEKMAVIGTLAAGINHEICNPLGIARGQCEVYLLNKKEGFFKNRSKDEQLAEAMNIMEKVIHESDRATSITKKLSSFAKPSKGEISNDVRIKEEINEVISLVGHELKLSKIDVRINIPNDLPPVTCDRKQMQQVLFNIVRNAGQAIGEKGIIEIAAVAEDDKIKIDIKDTGHGIPDNKLKEIFNPFYTTKEPGKGTGLGLFIVRQLVERNKGRIYVDSQVGHGTTFTLEFPVLEKVKT